MFKRLYFLISVVLVLALASSVSAQDDVTYWTDGGGDHVWCNPSNWDNGLPESNPNLVSWETRGVDAIINIEGITDAVLIGPGCNAEAAWVGVGASVNTGPDVGLNMTGGTFTLMEIELGQCDGGYGWMTMSGGTIDFYDYSYLAIGSNGGEGRLDMTGGEINVLGENWVGSPALQWAGTLRLPKNEGRCEGNDGVGHLQLDGGVIRVRILQMAENGTMDITGGALIITGRDSPEVQSWYGDLWDEVISEVNDGDLTAYGGSGIVGVEYLDNPDPNEPNEIWVVGRIDAATAWNPRPQNGAVDILKDVVLEWSAGDYVQSTSGHKLYFSESFADVNSRSVTPVVLHSTSYDAGANETLELGKVYYWAVDEVNGATTWAGPVWSFAMDRGVAKNPSPAHGSDEVPKTDAILSWTPGIEAATTGGHDVYFDTSSTAVNDADTSSDEFQGNQDDSNWPTNNYASSLDLIRTYYWRIDEINGSNLWKGDVWSFEVEGRAKNPIPADGAGDQAFLGLELSWEAGVDALTHDVYFGTDATAVADANTNSPEYKMTLPVGNESYTVPGELIVGGRYYWRIDENSPSVTAKGHVWSFKVGDFLVVDNFESYANNGELYEVWDDYWVNGSGGDIFLEKDVNIVRDPGLNPQAVLCWYTNSDKDEGSYFDVQDMTEVEIGSDWTVGGVKALQLQMRGDAATVLNETGGGLDYTEGWPWVELEDTSSNSGYVLYPAETITDILSPSWHEWNIDLAIFDACGVDLTAIDRFTIGIGGAKADQRQANKNTNQMWFDDIRLYPPRCRPEVSEQTGDFTGDCSVMYEDLDVMVTDWLLTDGNTPTENQPAALTGFPDETSHWVTGYIGGAIEVNEGYNIDVNDPRLFGLESMSITAWIKQPASADNEWVGIVCSREQPCGGTGEATEIGIYGTDWGGPGGLGYDWSCLSGAWQWDAELDVPDDTWTFIAMSVDPTGCTLYMRPNGEALQEGVRNWTAHPPQQNFANSFMIGRSNADGGYFVGAIDDVRIYTYDLNSVDVNNLAWQLAEPSPAPVYWYKFDEATGYTAADSGTITEVYAAVPSIANMTDPEPKLQRAVNLADFAILADNWMSQDFWP